MTIQISGTTGISGIDGTAGTPAFQGSDPNTGIYSPGADQVAISTNGSGRLFIDSNGKVGLGTSSPGTLLSLAGNNSGSTNNSPSATIRLENTNNAVAAEEPIGKIQFYGNDGTIPSIGEQAYILSKSNNTIGGGDLRFGTCLEGTATEKMRLTHGGALGIGTSTPGFLLNLKGTDPVLAIQPSADTETAYLAFRNTANSSSRGFIGYSYADEAMFFRTNAVERARIDSAGRLLVGTSSSLGTYLTQINFAGSGTNGLYVNSFSTSGDGSTMLAFVRASTPNNTVPVISYSDSTAGRFQLRNNGGLANYSANNVNLSDRNVKKDIEPAAGTWDCLKEWEIVNFRYKDQPDDADLNLGVIAQQVAESCPEVITVFQEATEDQPEKLGVKDQQMMWMAIKALQEAQLRIETLEAEVQALKGV